jgi:predicted Holliday junction resolvase-like endonuclease
MAILFGVIVCLILAYLLWLFVMTHWVNFVERRESAKRKPYAEEELRQRRLKLHVPIDITKCENARAFNDWVKKKTKESIREMKGK